MRRLAASATACLTLLLPACTDDAPEDTRALVLLPEGAPDLVVAGDDGVRAYPGGAVEGLAGPTSIAFADGRGGFVAQIGDRVLDDDGDVLADAPGLQLRDVVVVDGVPNLLYTTCGPQQGEQAGDLYLQALDGGIARIVALACAVDYRVAAASAAAGVVAVAAVTDLTETFFFADPRGRAVDWYDPAGELAYGEPPLLTGAALAPDATELAYLSGPDVGPDHPDERRGRWELVLVSRGGDERLRVGLDLDAEAEVAHLDFDGRWVLVSVADGPVLFVDTRAAAPKAVESGLTGVATIAEPSRSESGEGVPPDDAAPPP